MSAKNDFMAMGAAYLLCLAEDHGDHVRIPKEQWNQFRELVEALLGKGAPTAEQQNYLDLCKGKVTAIV